jgi:hypothetical protein
MSGRVSHMRGKGMTAKLTDYRVRGRFSHVSGNNSHMYGRPSHVCVKPSHVYARALNISWTVPPFSGI